MIPSAVKREVWVRGGPDPSSMDQPLEYASGRPTQNGLFHEAALAYREGRAEAEHVKVYEKLLRGTWVFNGVFRLADCWTEQREGRAVFKFRLEPAEEDAEPARPALRERSRMIPSAVKREVGCAIRSVRHLRRDRRTPLRPRHPVLGRGLVSHRGEHSHPLRAPQSREERPHRVTGGATRLRPTQTTLTNAGLPRENRTGVPIAGSVSRVGSQAHPRPRRAASHSCAAESVIREGLDQMVVYGGGSYSGPKEVSYLFVDGGYLRKIAEKFGNDFFDGAEPPIDYAALGSGFTKCFYYDCLPRRAPRRAPRRVARVRPASAIS